MTNPWDGHRPKTQRYGQSADPNHPHTTNCGHLRGGWHDIQQGWLAIYIYIFNVSTLYSKNVVMFQLTPWLHTVDGRHPAPVDR